MAGYIKLWRSTLAHRLIRNPYASQLFLWLILQARWTEGRERGVDLKRGELLSTMPRIQLELNLTEKQARLAIDILRSLNVIVTDRAHDGAGLGRSKETVFRFVNWDKHQLEETESQTSGQRMGQANGGGRAEVSDFSHTGKEDSSPKKDKKDKKEPSADAVAGKAFTDYFYEKHIKAHGQKPTPKVWTFKNCNTLATSLGALEIKRRCDNFFADPYLTSHPLETFLGSPDKWIAKREKLNLSKVDTQVQMDRKRTAL